MDYNQKSHFTLDTNQIVEGKAFALPASRERPVTPSLDAASTELASIRANLGFIDALVVDRKINRDAKRILAEGCVQLLEAKRQELLAKITVGLAESKKQVLVESLRVSGAIDKEISELSAHFAATMFDGALSANFAAAQEEYKRLEQLDATYKAGKLTESRYQQIREATTEAADHVVGIVKSNTAQIIHAHVGQIKIALELFRERTLNKAF
jgi:hypothetical protein